MVAFLLGMMARETLGDPATGPAQRPLEGAAQALTGTGAPRTSTPLRRRREGTPLWGVLSVSRQDASRSSGRLFTGSIAGERVRKHHSIGMTCPK
jgi:hypothetical protein